MINQIIFHGGTVFINTMGGGLNRLPHHIRQLEAGGPRLLAHFANVADAPFPHPLLNHIIGIEKWGQRRLEVFLGAELIVDEYDGYRPDHAIAVADLLPIFEETRRQTVALAKQLITTRPAVRRVVHNGYGNLTPSGWVYFLHLHADFERRKIKPGPTRK